MAQFLACTVPTVLWTPDSCHLAWMIAAVTCGLASSSCASNLWLGRYSVPVACLSHPWVHLVLSLRLAAVWLSYHLARRVASVACGLTTSSCTSTLWVEGHSVPEACLSHPWFDLVLSLRLADFFFFFFFFFYEWEHRMGTMCPFSSLHPSRKGEERQWKE